MQMREIRQGILKRYCSKGTKEIALRETELKNRDHNISIHREYKRRRQWHPTPVLLPGKSHGWRSLVGCSPWGHKELDMTAISLSLFTFMHWRRKWQPTPLFLPGESQGRRSLVGCYLRGHTESDTTEAT